MSAEPGDILPFIRKKDYLYVKDIGGGSFGRTILMKDETIDEYLVCKKYSPTPEEATKYFSYFTKEVKLLYKLCHRNIVRIFNHYLYPISNSGFIMMEYIDGSNINIHVKSNPESINDLFLQSIVGFCHLESLGILHRDIRYGNLMVTNDGILKIIDFGFGKHVIVENDADKSITNINWIGPRPLEFDDGIYNHSTEVYFIGCLFRSLTNELNLDVFEYRDFLDKMCKIDPKNRYASFSELQSSLSIKRFDRVEFSDTQLEQYRKFSAALGRLIVRIDVNAKYLFNKSFILSLLERVYETSMLEKSVHSPAQVAEAFLDGEYETQFRVEFDVNVLREFISLLSDLNDTQWGIVLDNIHSRLDSKPRYNAREGEIPF